MQNGMSVYTDTNLWASLGLNKLLCCDIVFLVRRSSTVFLFNVKNEFGFKIQCRILNTLSLTLQLLFSREMCSTSYSLSLDFPTWKNILFKDMDVWIPVRSAVFMKEADCVAQLVNNVSYFTPQCRATYCQFLAFVSTATNARCTAI